MPNSVEIQPLNPYPDFPFRVDPIPQDWLRQFAGFAPIPTSDKDRKAPEDGNHFED